MAFRALSFTILRYRISWRTLVAMLALLSLCIMAGCGGTTSSGSFTASPGGGGTPSGGSTGVSTTASSVSAVSAPSTSIASGSTLSASVTLNAAAPAGGAQVSLTSSNAAVASVPATVTVAAGQTAANFPVTTGAVSADTSVQITAAYNNTLAGFTVSVRAPATPPPPAGSGVALTLSPTSVTLVAGAKQLFTATVTGSTNTAVTWSVSGGAIAYNGFFTAPSVTTTSSMTVTATSQADPTVSKTAQVTVTPVPPPSGSGYSGTGPVASWKAYQYKDTDGLYHQAIKITGTTTPYPVIGYSYSRADCTNLGDKFNDFWQPLGNGLWWFINRAELIYVKWVWYDNAQNKNILQQTPCIDYSGAPKYN
jgi:hypothetical protein